MLTCLQCWRICNRIRELTKGRSGVDERQVGRILWINREHRDGIASSIDSEQVLNSLSALQIEE